MEAALTEAKLTPEDIAWKCASAQRAGTVYARVPVRILRKEAQREGFTSVKDYLDACRAEGKKHQ
jgi:hypothetical protein